MAASGSKDTDPSDGTAIDLAFDGRFCDSEYTKMNILFSTTAANVQAELDAKFPGKAEQVACKLLLFARLRDADRLPARFLQDTQEGAIFKFLVDVPSATSVADVAAQVSPFASESP